ncbi:PKD domain-containing protein [archaeon]|jgi:PKD repeat protein|nr:PKD domain-containing protein [archaeon]MBT4241664.1 PKD domain-containing protein [archaeon]MBT4418059.1 PKD domain-containing protein [archaeon]
MKFKSYFFLMFFGIVLFSLSGFVLGEFTQGDEVYDIKSSYGPGAELSGWINISLNNEGADSKITGFSSEISIHDFLINNIADFDCVPVDCESSYSSSGSGSVSKETSLEFLETGVLGVRLTGSVDDVSSFSFKINSDSGNACLHPLQIDILNDGSFEWKSVEVGNDFTCIMEDSYACFNEDDIKGEFRLTTNTYCNKVDLLPPSKIFQIGAEILKDESTGDENVFFKLELSVAGNYEECSVSANSAGQISCNVEIDSALEESSEAEICISVEDASDDGKYNIKYEDVSPCGFFESNDYDFPIFIKPGKYSGVSEVIFSEAELEIDVSGDIENYIFDKYEGNCDPECIVPLGFYAGVAQTISLSDLRLTYNSGSKEETKIYEIEESNAMISADFQELDLDYANIIVPSDLGSESLDLKLGGRTIFTENIEIVAIPQIENIIPAEAPSLVDVNFKVLLDGSTDDLSYSWDFGDGSETETSENNTISHLYENTGTYTLSVEISNDEGSASKAISVNIVSPKNLINKTIRNYRNDLDNIEESINFLPEWVGDKVSEEIGLEDLGGDLDGLEGRYDEGFLSDDESVEIMRELNALEIPYQLNISVNIDEIRFVPEESQIDLEILKQLGAGDYDDRDAYINGINLWLRDNLDVNFESKTYSIYFRNGDSMDLLSFAKIILKPKENLDEFYVVINGDANEIFVNSDVNSNEFEESNALGITFSDLSEDFTIEFTHPESISLTDVPVYISAEFKELEISYDAGICNNDGKCNGDEDYKNCRADCKPWLWVIIFLIILFFVALAVYIALQEWYKRNYENSLFKNKNQLFNLISFMNNASIQGMQKASIFKQLKEKGWKSEQLNYAWGKFKGKRTGMWEIPVFKWAENKKVKNEIAKRKNVTSPVKF